MLAPKGLLAVLCYLMLGSFVPIGVRCVSQRVQLQKHSIRKLLYSLIKYPNVQVASVESYVSHVQFPCMESHVSQLLLVLGDFLSSTPEKLSSGFCYHGFIA